MKRILKTMIAGALSVPLLVAAGPASAEVLDQNKVGSALALLFLTADEPVFDGKGTALENTKDKASTVLPIVTSVVVTNTSAHDSIILAAEVINGDPNEHWTGQSFRCPMTPGETTQFVFSPDGIVGSSTSILKYECSQPGVNGLFAGTGLLSIPKTTPLAASMGILWLTIEGPAYPNPTLSHNILEGKSVVLNFFDGTAYEVGAVPFQSPVPEAQDFDSVYEFDGRELARWPESLTASFHAPSFNVDAAGMLLGTRAVRAQLVLFTLDGRLSSHLAPNAEAVVYFFNDDEEFFNTSLYFDCFTMIELEDIDTRFYKHNLGSAVGHIEIIPQSVDPADENHDAMFANDDNKRRVPIAGWLVQKLEAGGQIMDAQGMLYPMPANVNANDSAWASLLSTSMTPLPNEPGDTPTLTR